MEGSKVEEILNAKLMEKGVWISINQRIGDWALKFQLACAANPETTLEQLIRGRYPIWSARCLSHGFSAAPVVAMGGGPPELPGVVELRSATVQIRDVFTFGIAVDLLKDLTDVFCKEAHGRKGQN